PNTRTLYWTDRGDPPRGNTVNRAPLDATADRRPAPEIVFKHLMEGIGLALDLKGGRMFITDLTGPVYSANLDGPNQKALLGAQGNTTGIAYAELADVHKAKANGKASVTAVARAVETNGAADPLTKALEHQLSNPATSAEFDFHKGVNQI